MWNIILKSIVLRILEKELESIEESELPTQPVLNRWTWVKE